MYVPTACVDASWYDSSGTPVSYESPESRPLPGSKGTPFCCASSRAVCLRPKARICSGVGPMKAMPSASHCSAKPGFSDRNP